MFETTNVRPHRLGELIDTWLDADTTCEILSTFYRRIDDQQKPIRLNSKCANEESPSAKNMSLGVFPFSSKNTETSQKLKGNKNCNNSQNCKCIDNRRWKIAFVLFLTNHSHNDRHNRLFIFICIPSFVPSFLLICVLQTPTKQTSENKMNTHAHKTRKNPQGKWKMKWEFGRARQWVCVYVCVTVRLLSSRKYIYSWTEWITYPLQKLEQPWLCLWV